MKTHRQLPHNDTRHYFHTADALRLCHSSPRLVILLPHPARDSCTRVRLEAFALTQLKSPPSHALHHDGPWASLQTHSAAALREPTAPATQSHAARVFHKTCEERNELSCFITEAARRISADHRTFPQLETRTLPLSKTYTGASPRLSMLVQAHPHPRATHLPPVFSPQYREATGHASDCKTHSRVREAAPGTTAHPYTTPPNYVGGNSIKNSAPRVPPTRIPGSEQTLKHPMTPKRKHPLPRQRGLIHDKWEKSLVKSSLKTTPTPACFYLCTLYTRTE